MQFRNGVDYHRPLVGCPIWDDSDLRPLTFSHLLQTSSQSEREIRSGLNRDRCTHTTQLGARLWEGRAELQVRHQLR